MTTFVEFFALTILVAFFGCAATDSACDEEESLLQLRGRTNMTRNECADWCQADFDGGNNLGRHCGTGDMAEDCGACSFCQGGDGGSGTVLKVMSYNTEYKGYWDGRLWNFGDKIREVNAAVVGTQECQNVEALAKASGYLFVPGLPGNDILYNPRQVSYVERSNGSERIPRDNHAVRYIVWARFIFNGTRFLLFNTHLPHRHNEAWNANTHAGIAKQVLKKREDLGAGDSPTVITGDFNPFASDGASQGSFESNVVAGGFRMAYKAQGNPGYSGLDKIFVSPQFNYFNGADQGTGSSDHPAISVDLTLKSTETPTASPVTPSPNPTPAPPPSDPCASWCEADFAGGKNVGRHCGTGDMSNLCGGCPFCSTTTPVPTPNPTPSPPPAGPCQSWCVADFEGGNNVGRHCGTGDMSELCGGCSFCNSGGSSGACLCVFDIDRTLTGKQGATNQCPGNEQTDLDDHAYGGGKATLSALSAQGISTTFCNECYLGITSAGGGSGAGSPWNNYILEHIMRGVVMDAFVQQVPSAKSWSYGTNVNSPWVLYQGNKIKQNSVELVRRWYGRYGVSIVPSEVYFFGDRTENIEPFKNFAMNSREISCGSRDRQLYHGSGIVGFCGARPDEIVKVKGNILCS